MSSVGGLYATLSLDDAQYQAAMKKAPSIASQTAAKINTAFNRNPAIDNAAKAVAGLASDIKLQASALGVSVRAWDQFNAVGRASGVSGKDLVRTFASLRGQLDLARVGTAETVAGFSALGINWRSLTRASPEDALQQIALAMHIAGEGTDAYRAGLEILNAKDHPQMQQLLHRLARQDLRSLAESATRTGGTIRRELGGAFLGIVAPTAIIAGLVSLGRSALRAAEEMKDLSDQTGLAINQMSALDYVARQNATTGKDFVGAISRMRERLADAERGASEARLAFAGIGLDWRALVKLSPAQLIETVARAMVTAGEGTREYGAAVELLGTRNLPRLNASLRALGTESFAGAEEAARRANQQWGPEMVQRLEKAQQAIENFKRSLTLLAGETIDLFNPASWPRQITEVERSLELLTELEARVRSLRDAGDSGGALILTPQLDALRSRFVEDALEDQNEVYLRSAKLRIEAFLRERTAGIDATREQVTTAQRYHEDLTAALRKLEEQRTSKAAEEANKRADAAKDAAESEARSAALLLKELEDKLRDLREKSDFQIKLGSLDEEPLQRIVLLTEELNRQRARLNDNALGADDREDAGRRVIELTGAIKQEEEAILREGRALNRSTNSREAYARRVEELDTLLKAGAITQDTYTRALEDAADEFKSIKTPAEQYESTLRTLNRLQADGAISANAYARAVKNAAIAAGSARLGDVRNQAALAGAGGGSRTQRSIEKNLARAEQEAARGNAGAAQQFLRRAEELGATIRGTSLEETVGRAQSIDPGSNEGKALRDQAARNAFLGQPTVPTPDDKGSSAAGTGDPLVTEVRDLVKAINDVAKILTVA